MGLSAICLWFTDWFTDLVCKRQRTHSGDLNQAKILRNKVHRAASKLKYNFTKHKLQQCMNRDPTIGEAYENNNGT